MRAPPTITILSTAILYQRAATATDGIPSVG